MYLSTIGFLLPIHEEIECLERFAINGLANYLLSFCCAVDIIMSPGQSLNRKNMLYVLGAQRG